MLQFNVTNESEYNTYFCTCKLTLIRLLLSFQYSQFFQFSQQIFEVNVKASFFLVKEVVPYMQKRGYVIIYHFSLIEGSFSAACLCELVVIHD